MCQALLPVLYTIEICLFFTTTLWDRHYCLISEDAGTGKWSDLQVMEPCFTAIWLQGFQLSCHRVLTFPYLAFIGWLSPTLYRHYSMWSSQKQWDGYHYSDLGTKRLKSLLGSREVIYIHFINMDKIMANQSYSHNQNVGKQNYMHIFSLLNLFKLIVMSYWIVWSSKYFITG